MNEPRPVMVNSMSLQGQDVFPPGMLGEVASFFLAAAPRPVSQIALSGAIGYLAGILGNAYNVSGTGLNQYILQLASTGSGKELVASGKGRLNFHVHDLSKGEPFPHNGPGELVSSAGLIKWLLEYPCNCTIIGEAIKKLREITNPRNSNAYGLGRTILQLYPKSGAQDSFDPMAYSDREKRTGVIYSPSFTIWGEGNPENFYEILDEGLISDGLLPRFMVFEYVGKRERLNKLAKDAVPTPHLVQRLKELVAHCAMIRTNRTAHNVELTPEAEALFDGFDNFTTDEINGAGGVEVTRQLWNRAHLKALKLAALCAVGENPTHPLVTLAHAEWAIKIVSDQTRSLIARFTSNHVGEEAGDEAKQLAAVIRVVSEYAHAEYETYAKYGGGFDMHRDGVIMEAHIQRRLFGVAAFKGDKKAGPTAAIKRALKTLLDADELREMPRQQMLEKYGSGPRSFVVANPGRFRKPSNV